MACPPHGAESASPVQPSPSRPAFARRTEHELYNALFCDALPEKWAPTTAFYRISKHSLAELRRVFDSAASESRLRLLAAAELRRRGHPVGSRAALGVIVEVTQDEGLSVLAAYADGQVRYIAATGGVLSFENAPPRISFLGRSLVAAAQPVVPLIAPNTETRGAPPEAGKARLTLLTGQGRFTGDGQLDALRNDSLAGPLIVAAQTLLEAICDAFPRRSGAHASTSTVNAF
jgi:hypothetical protein